MQESEHVDTSKIINPIINTGAQCDVKNLYFSNSGLIDSTNQTANQTANKTANQTAIKPINQQITQLINFVNVSVNYPPIDKSFKTLDGVYLINISTPDFFTKDATSRDLNNANTRIWLVRITNLHSKKSYCGECCEYFWKPFVGLFLAGVDLKPNNIQKKITVKFSEDEIDFDEVKNTTLVEVKDYEATLFVE
jgi:hypothetical protein